MADFWFGGGGQVLEWLAFTKASKLLIFHRADVLFDSSEKFQTLPYILTILYDAKLLCT